MSKLKTLLASCFIVVACLVSAAISQDTDGLPVIKRTSVYAGNQSELPKSTNPYPPAGAWFDWQIDFDWNCVDESHNIITFYVIESNFYLSFDSDNYSFWGHETRTGTAYTSSGQDYLLITEDLGDGQYEFWHMRLQVTYHD